MSTPKPATDWLEKQCTKLDDRMLARELGYLLDAYAALRAEVERLRHAMSMQLIRERSKHMDFSMALTLIKAGKRMARARWNGEDMFVFLVPGSQFQVNRPPLLGIYPEGTTINYQSHIDMRTADGSVAPWLASQTDLLANDWFVVG